MAESTSRRDHNLGCNMNEKMAFKAMGFFLAQYYQRAGNDMETLIADISLEADGEPLDPAAWDDWLECIRLATEGKGSGSLPDRA